MKLLDIFFMFIFSLELSRMSKDAKKTCDLSYVGVQALKSHVDGKKHEVVAVVSVFFKKSSKSRSTSSESSQRNANSSTQQQTLDLTINKSQVSIAEIRWALQTVT